MKDFLHHLFIPRPSNNHRSKLLHNASLLFFIIFLLFIRVSFSFLQNSHPGVLGINANINISDLLNLTNQKRAEAGLPPLSLSDQLDQAAAGKARDMFTKNYWAHLSPDGLTPWVFIKGAGYEYLYAGENLARGFTTAQDVINAWMASQGHRENMLSRNYKDVGFAVVGGQLTGEDTVLVVEMLGTRYLAKTTPSITQTASVSPVPVPPSPVATISPLPHIVPSPSFVLHKRQTYVASFKSQPLVNSRMTTRFLALFLTVLFIFVLILDMIIIKRKKIVRFVGHNLDHIIFLTILLLIILIFGKGTIL